MKRLQQRKNRTKMGKGRKKKIKITKNKVVIHSKSDNENLKKKLVISNSPNSSAKTSIKQKRYNCVPQTIEDSRLISTKRASSIFNKCMSYLKESRLELNRVVWPSRKQVFGSTCIVLLVVGIFSLFFGVVDIILSTIHQLILRQ